MITKGKYVVGEIPLVAGSNIGAILICEYFGHDVLRPCFTEILSAGFFHLTEDGQQVVVYGESIGLKVKSEPERDARLIAKVLALT